MSTEILDKPTDGISGSGDFEDKENSSFPSNPSTEKISQEVREQKKKQYNLRSSSGRAGASLTSVTKTDEDVSMSPRIIPDDSVFMTPRAIPDDPIETGAAGQVQQVKTDGEQVNNGCMDPMQGIASKNCRKAPENEDAILMSANVDLNMLRDHMHVLTMSAALNDSGDHHVIKDEEENDDLPCNVTVYEEESISIYQPSKKLEFPGNFCPVDVAQGQRFTYITSQVTSQVAIFEGTKFVSFLKKERKETLFRSPRNVICVPVMFGHEEKMIVIVLDDEAFHLYKEGGSLMGRFKSHQGLKYRGLGYYKCSKSDDAFTYVVSLDVSEGKHGSWLCVFRLASNTIGEQFRFRIEASKGTIDPKCRFLTVSSVCSPTLGCSKHNAIVTGMDSGQIYSVDICNKTSKILEIKGEEMPELTFVEPDDSLRELKSLITPTGICIDSSGNLMVADNRAKCIKVLTVDGQWLRTIPVTFKPIGLLYDKPSATLFLVANNMREVQMFDMASKKFS